MTWRNVIFQSAAGERYAFTPRVIESAEGIGAGATISIDRRGVLWLVSPPIAWDYFHDPLSTRLP